MKCPSCESLLVMSERQGIEIDYCPKCRGVWLDKGELDKIIERASAQGTPSPPEAPPSPLREPYEDRNRNYFKERDDYRDRRDYNPYYKKKKGFLGDLFDFD